MYAPILRCRRCGGSVISQQFTDDSGRGTRWTCLSCAEETEQLDRKLVQAQTGLRRLAVEAADSAPRGRPRKVS
jgi:hypothetical protein